VHTIEAQPSPSIVDADSHLSEPADTWTARLPAKWRDQAPKVVPNPRTGKLQWQIGDQLVASEGAFSHAGWQEYYPSTPPSLSEADPACWDAKSRLQRMDEYGISQQILYPNLIGFHYQAFRAYEPALRLACVQAYNDFQIEFCEADPQRLIPLMNLPFWDVDQSVMEMNRCRAMGHKGINFGWQFDRIGLPKLRDPHWFPLLHSASELELPISFHIGFNSTVIEDAMKERSPQSSGADIVQQTALFFLGNANCIAELIMGGICERFPNLSFVSVESGFGFLPFFLQSLDWQFVNTAARAENPRWLLPSEYFRRQIYSTIWFEKGVGRQIDLYPDNVMFSSDFPHPTSLSPGPGSTALSAQQTFEMNLGDLEPTVRDKVLQGTARRLYHLTVT
jgi:predicted TIM-barrel fold metal-dependent hydrolase